MKKKQNRSFTIKGYWLFLLILLILGFPLTVSGYDTRILSLNSPTLSQTKGATLAGVGGNIIFPTDEFGLGLSSVPDTFDIWKLPNRLADKELFPSNSVILNYTGSASGNGGIVITPGKLPFTLGVFAVRSSQNGWVIGSPRGDLGLLPVSAANVDVTYWDNRGPLNVGPAAGPGTPSNVVDVIGAMKLGSILFGAGVGYSYNKDLDSITSIKGTADSTTTQKSTSSVFTVRAGAGLDLKLKFPSYIDLGAILAISNYEATYKSGAAAAVPNEDDSIKAENTTLSFSARVAGSFLPNLEVVLLGDFVTMPQNFTLKDDGTELDSTAEQVDDTSFSSFGLGGGINWTPSEKALVNALITAVFGSGAWVDEAPGAPPRPEDSLKWKTFRGVIDGEVTLTHWMILRGGIGEALSWTTTKMNVATGGTSSETKTFTFNSSAAAGVGFKIKDPVTLDFMINLANLASSNPFQALAMQTTLKVDF